MMEFKKNYLSVFTVWLLCAISLVLTGYLGYLLKPLGGIAYLIQSIMFTGMVVLGIYLIRKTLDRGLSSDLGVGRAARSFVQFMLGVGLMFVPLMITLSLSWAFGWTSYSLNMDWSILLTQVLAIVGVLLFEAVPEELAFRGFIYGRLNVHLRRWGSALITLVLFVFIPVLVVPIQNMIFGGEVSMGAMALSPGYMINMFLFGAFVMYLRMISGSIWMGVGFHFMFVYLNRMIGLEETSLIQIVGNSQEMPVKITLMVCLLIIGIGLAVYPRISGRRIGWKQYA